MIPLGCKNTALKHVLSDGKFLCFSLHLSVRKRSRENSYMLHASTDNLKCFECGNLGHKCFSFEKVENEQRLTCRLNIEQIIQRQHVQAVEEGSIDELDGLFQCTDDSM